METQPRWAECIYFVIQTVWYFDFPYHFIIVLNILLGCIDVTE